MQYVRGGDDVIDAVNDGAVDVAYSEKRCTLSQQASQ